MTVSEESLKLKKEVERLKKLVEESNSRELEFRREMNNDPIVGEILRLRREVESRKAFEADLLTGAKEIEEELAALRETDNALLDEAETAASRKG